MALRKLEGILFPGEAMRFLNVSFEDYGQAARELAGKVKKSKTGFDSIVGIEKGGLFVYQALADLLKIKKMGTIKVVRTAEGSFSLEKYMLEKPVNIPVAGDTVLLVDDVVDQGTTFKIGVKHLEQKGAKKVYTAAPYAKPPGLEVADFAVFLTESWILFPTDLRENIENLSSRWQDSGLSKKEITRRLNKLNLTRTL